MMIVMAILSVLAFLNVFTFDIKGILTGIIYGVAYGYCFVVLHSLFTTFRDEKEGVAATPNSQDTKA